MSLNQLFYNSVELAQTDKATVSANFLCPVCSARPESKLSTAVTIPTSRDLDSNRQVTFIMPCCGTKITLYVAVHKTRALNDLRVCIATEPIPAEWWHP